MARGEFQRVFLWSVWVTNLLVNVCFVLICWATADNLARMSGTLHLPASPGAGAAAWSSAAERTARAFVSKGIWRAPIAACAIGGVMATLFNVTSCLVLVRKSMTTAAPGFGYGFVTAWALVLAFTTLLCGLVLEAFKSTVRDHVDPATAAAAPSAPSAPLDAAAAAADGSSSNGTLAGASAVVAPAAAGARGWTRAMTGAYAASYGFAYACTALYSLFFLVLLVFQKAVAKQLSPGGGGALTRQQEMGVVAAAAGGAAGGGPGGLYSQANTI